MFNKFCSYLQKRRDLQSKRQANIIKREICSTLFSNIGLEELEQIVEKGKENRKTKGHTDYASLGQLYCKTFINDLEIEECNS